MKENRTYLAKIILASTDAISCDKQNAEEYLAAEGLDVAAIKAEGLMRIKRLQMQARAAKARAEMASAADSEAKQRAMAWVDQILNDARFSFAEFVKEENLVLQNRNLTSLTQDDIRSTLTQYFYLKFLNQQGESGHA